MMLILSLLLGSNVLNAQTYQLTTDCAGGAIPASVILANAVTGGGATIPFQTGGTWTRTAGLTFSTLDENALITKTTAGNNNYQLDWEVETSPGVFETYDILLKTRPGFTAPTVIDFYALNTLQCTTPYDADVVLTISGGNGNYNIDIVDEVNASIYTNTLTSPITNYNIDLGSYSTDKDFTITTVTDNSGCIADLESVSNATFNAFTSPALFNVTNLTNPGGSVCTPGPMSLQLNNSEKDILYQLRRDGTAIVETWTSPNDGDQHVFADVSTLGLYEVYAFDPCANAYVSMNGSYSLIAPPAEYDVRIVESLPHCEGSNFTFEVSGSEVGVTYRLYNGATLVATHVGVGGAFSFANISDAGTYSLVADNGTCTATMNPTTSLLINPKPVLYAVTGGSVCEGTTLDIGLTGADPGITYTLYRDGVFVTSKVGSANFSGNIIVGEYSILASNMVTGCTQDMSGVATIYAYPNDISFTATSPQYVCGSGNITIPVGQDGVTYTLYVDTGSGSNPVGSLIPQNGNGVNPVFFSGLTVSGIYTVHAQNGICSRFLSDVLVIETAPVSQTVSVPVKSYCEGDVGVNINLGDTETTINYVLVDGANNDVDQITGDGNPRSFVDVKAGIYTVEARSTNLSCNLVLASNIVIVEHPLPTNLDLNIPTSFCADAGPQTIYATPTVVAGTSTGQFSIIGGTGFDTGAAFDPDAGSIAFDPAACAPETEYTIEYVYIDGNGCSITDIAKTTIHDLNNGSVTINSSVPANPCQDDNVNYDLAGLYNSNAVSGTFSSTSLGLNTINNAAGTAKFRPSDAGNGSHTITFDYADANGCTGSASIVIVIGTPVSITGLASSYCTSDDTDYRLEGQVGTIPPSSADGSTFKIIDPDDIVISSGIANDTQDFNPKQLYASTGKDGVYKVVYEYLDGSCLNDITHEVELIKTPDPTFVFPDDASSNEQDKFCSNHGEVVLTSNDADIASYLSQYSLNGAIIGSSFNTITSSVNLFPTNNTIVHRAENNGCVSTSTRTFSVYEPNETIVGLCSEYFANDAVFTIQASELNTSIGTATFTMEASDGTPITWITNNGDNTATIDPTNHPGNDYTIVMTFAAVTNGCEQVVTQDIDIYPSLAILGFNDGDKICKGSSTVNIGTTLLPTGGTAVYTPLTGLTDNSDGTAELDPSVMTPGIHVVEFTFTGADGCSRSITKTLEILDAPTDVFKVVGGGFYCKEATNKGLTIGLDGSVAGVKYELLLNGSPLSPVATFDGNSNAFKFTVNNDGTGGDQLFTVDGTYTVMAIQNNCTAAMDGSVDVVMYEPILQLLSKTDITCNGLSDGIVELSGTGGSGNYEFRDEDAATPTWQSSPIFTGLAKGDHNFSIRDISLAADKCDERLSVLTVNIVEPTAIQLTEDLTQNVKVGCTPCSSGGTCEGSATILISGGTPDYTTYPTNGYNIVWSNGGNNLSESGLDVGTYTVNVTDGNACPATVSIIIDSNPALTISEDPNPALQIDNVCNLGTDGEYVVTASGGTGIYQFSLVDPATAVEADWLPANVGINGYNVKNLAAGSYNIWVRDADPLYKRCTAKLAAPIIITEPAAITVIEESQTPITCNSATDATFTVRASGGLSGTFNFSITDPALGATWLPANNGVDGYTYTVGAGVHSVWVQDAVNVTCDFVKVDVTILDVNALSFTIDDHQNVSCFSGNNGRLEVTGQGGSGNYVYQWESPLGTIISTDRFIENRVAGDYHVTIQDQNDSTNVCRAVTHTFTITQPTALSLVEVDNQLADCSLQNNGVLEINVSGGTTDFISYPGLGYDIIWSNGEINKERIENLSPGSYTVEIVDANGCTINNLSSPYTVGVLADITLESSSLTHNDCFDDANGEVFVKVDGGSSNYEFRLQGDKIVDWSLSVPINSDEYTWSGLTKGNYEVLVRDVNNASCEFSMGTFTITEGAEITVNNNPAIDVTDVSCNGGSDGAITIYTTGGSGVYDYSLDNGASWIALAQPATYTFTNLFKGTYFIKVRDALGCESTNVLTVDVDEVTSLAFALNPSVTHVSCFSGNDGEIVVTGQGGSGNYDYSIDKGVNWQPTGTFKDLFEGTYYLSIRDRANVSCEEIDLLTIQINQPADFTCAEDLTKHIDVNCYGDATGSFTVVASGGEGNFEYSLFDGTTRSAWQSSPIFSGLSAQTYQVSLRDLGTSAANFCEKTDLVSVTITEPTSRPTIDNVSIIDVDCYNGNSGEIDVTASGGTTPYTYQWIRQSDNSVVTAVTPNNPIDLFADSYKVIVTDDKGCFVEQAITVNQPLADINVSHNPTHITVAGADDGTITVNTPTGGTAPYAITWSDGVAYDGLYYRDNLAATTYSYTITDSKSCDITQNVTIIASDALNFGLTTNTPLNCYGANTGFIEVAITGGTAPFNIEWNGTLYDATTDSGSDTNIGTNYTISNLYAGTYTVKITDANGDLTKVKTIAQPDEITITQGPFSNITCYHANDGFIEVNVNSATDPSAYAMSWSGPGGYSKTGTVSTVNRIDNLVLPGDYYATVYYNGTCNVTEVFTITEPNELNVVIDPSNTEQVLCTGGSDGQIGVTPSGGIGFGYTWYKWNDALATADKYEVIAGETNPIIKNRDAGKYKVVVELFSTGCLVDLEYELIDPDPLTLSLTPTHITTCYNDPSGKLSMTIGGGEAPYRYNIGNGDNLLAVTETFKELSGLDANTYNVVITDNNGCVITDSETITEPDELLVTLDDYGISCEIPVGGPDGFLDITIEGGYSIAGSQDYIITLKPSSGLLISRSVSNNTAVAISESFTGLLPDSYEVNVYDQNSTATDKCVFTDNFVLELITISGMPVDASCESVNDGEIQNVNVSGASINYTYAWSTLDGGVGFDDSTLDQAGLSKGTYRLTVTDPDRSSCSVSEDFVVDTASMIIIDAAITDVDCFGTATGAIDVKPNNPGYSYTWTGPSITAANQNNEDISNLLAGRYQLVVANGACGYVVEYDVNETTLIDYLVSYEITSCSPYERTIEITGLIGGTGNPLTDYIYTVSGPGSAVQDPTDKTRFVVTQGGEYTVEVFDKNLCSTTKTINIPAEIGKNEVITHVKCNGGNTGSIILNLSGGTGVFTYQWTKTGDTSFNETTPTIDKLTSGEYTVIVSDDLESDGSGQCSRSWDFTVNEPTPIVIGVDKGDITCNGNNDGFINLDINGGVAPYIFNWSPASGGIIQGLQNQAGLYSGSYSVTVIDDNGCLSSETIDINEDAPISGVLAPTDTQCDGTNGSIILTPSGGSGNYVYNWSTVDGDHSALDNSLTTQTGLTGGTYTVVITDQDPAKTACKTELSTTLTKGLQITNVSITDVQCAGNNSGRIEFDVTGGDANYTYVWTTLEGDPTLIQDGVRNQSGLSAGKYQVEITDARSSGTNCSITEVFEVKSTNPITVNGSVTNVECYGSSTGEIYISITGGSGNFDFNWNSGAYTTQNITGVLAGNYTLIVTDNTYGCTSTYSYVISEPAAPLSIDSWSSQDIKCKGDATGEINVVVAGGVLPYTYIWTGPNNPTGANPTGLIAGTYSLIVEDDNKCQVATGDIILSEPAQSLVIDPNYSVTNATTAGGTEGSIQISVSGGTGVYHYQWYDDLGNPIGTDNSLLDNIGEGSYDVVVTDDNGCTDQINNIIVADPNTPLSFTHKTYNVRPCFGNANGIIDITSINGGTPDMSSGSPTYHIEITQGAVTLVDQHALNWTYTNVVPGTYTIKITDAGNISESAVVTISEESELKITTSVNNDASCYNGADGSISVTVSGGKPDASDNYLVEIAGDNGYYDSKTDAEANVAFDFNGLPVGSYIIRVTDYMSNFNTYPSGEVALNCSAEDLKTIKQPEAQVLLSVQPGDESICIGDKAELSLAISNYDVVTSNLVVTIYDGDDYTDYTVDKTPFNIDVTPDRSRFYTVSKVALFGNTACLQGFDITPAPIEVNVSSLPTATVTSATSVICLGEDVMLSVAFSEQGPWTFTWEDTNNGTSGTITTSDNPYQLVDAPIADAQYSITSVSNGSCSNVGNGIVNVNVNSNPTVALTGSTAICANDAVGATLHFDFTGQAPYSVVVDANAIEQTIVFNANSEDWTVYPSETTTYTVKSIKDNNGCELTVSGVEAIVTVNALPEAIASIAVDDAQYTDGVCQGAVGVDYSITPVAYASGGYTWTAPANSSIISGNGSTNVTLEFDTNFSGGYLEVRAVNACANGPKTQLWIPAKPLPTATGAISGPTELCQGEAGFSYSIAPAANATEYRWEVPSGFSIIGDDKGAAIIVDLDPMLNTINSNIKVTAVNNCGDALTSSTLNIEVFPLPIAYAGADGNVCGMSDTYTMMANNPALIDPAFEGQWTIVSGTATITNDTQHNTTITNLSRGDVVFRWTVRNTASVSLCSVYSDVTIRNNELSVLASANNTSVCDSQVELTGTELPKDDAGNVFVNTVGLWDIVEPSGSAAIISQSANNVTNVSNLEDGRNVFRWTITQNGCASSALVEVYNNEPSDAIIDQGAVVDVCDDEVTISAVNPTIGNGTWTLVSGSGVIATPNNNSTLITNLRKGENVFKYTVENNGCSKTDVVTVYNNMLDVDAGENKVICDDVYVLDATPSDLLNGITGQWSTPESVIFVDGQSATTEVQGLKQGDNVLTWTLTQKGCASSASVTITNDLPTPAVVGHNQDICAYETVLQANLPNLATGETAFWSVIKGSGKFDDYTQADTRVSGLNHGENIFRWTIMHENCSSSADVVVYNQHVDVYAGKDTVICGKTITLNANQPLAGDVGEWSLIAGVGGATYKPSERNNPTILMGGLDYDVNGFVWTIVSDGCTSSDSVYVTNNNPYYTDSSGDKREISAGAPITIFSGTSALMAADAPDGGGIGVWSLVSGGGDIVDVNNAGTLINNLQRGENVFRWTVSKGNCSYWSYVTVTNGSVEEANAGRDQSVCTPEATLLANEPLNALGEWSVIDGAGNFADRNKFNTTVTDLDAGDNVFVWTLYNGATEHSDTVVVTNNIVIEADAGLGGIVCNQDWIDLSATIPEAGRGTATWSVVSGAGVFDDINDPSTRISGLHQGNNQLKYVIEFRGCSSTDYTTVVNNTPTTPIAGDSITTCVDSLQLRPNTPTFGVGEWVVESGNADALALDEGWAKRLAPGENVLLWRITNNGCVLEDSLVITNNQPDVAYAGGDKPVCEDYTKLSANQPLSGQGVGHWELISGSGTIVDPLDRETEVTGLGLGANRFKWIIDNKGCKSSDEVNISYNMVEAFAGYDPPPLCTNEIVLSANAAHPGVGTWGIVAGAGTAVFEDMNDPNTKVSGLDPGDNRLTWTISYGGCQSVSEVVVTNNSPTVADAGPDQTLCTINQTMLNANIPDTDRGVGKWSIRNGAGSFTSIDVNNPTVSDIAFGDNIFRWTIENKGCISVDDVVVSYDKVQATVEADRPICSDETLLVANVASPGVGTWSVVGGTSQAVFEDQNDPNTKVTKLAKGANVLRWSINYRGCTTSADVVITNNAPSTAYAGNIQELCDDFTSLDATVPNPGVGTWDVLMGAGAIANVNDAKSEVTGLSKGDNVFRWTVTNGVCTSVDEVRIVNNEPSIPYAGKDEESCENFMTLKAEEPLFGSGQWSIVQGGGNFDDPTSPTATIKNLNQGDNILKWTVSRGHCDLEHTITITNNAPAVASAGPDIEECKDWTKLDANIPDAGFGTGQWTLISGKGTFDDISNAKTSIRSLGFGENVLMWTITKGSCFYSDQVTIFNKIPDQSAAGDDQTTCDDYITLNANDPVDGTGLWTVESGAGVFEDETHHSTRVSDLGYGENVFKWTISYGDCTTEDIVVITSNKAKPFAGEDNVTYVNEYILQAENPGILNGTWQIISGGGNIEDPNFFNTKVTNLPVGKTTFRWTINTSGCEAYDDVTIEYKEVPEAGFTVDADSGCFPHAVNFTNYSVGGSVFDWEFGDGGTSTLRNPSYTYQNPGVYTAILTVQGPDGHDAVYTQMITVHDHPVADFSVEPEKVYLPQDEIRCYDLSIDAASWYWEFGDGQTSTDQNPRYTYEREGVYSIRLTVENAFGCTNSYKQDDVVTAIMSGYIEFPTAFKPRPGGVGNSGTIGERSDAIFKPKSKDVEEFHMQIFNRWGQLIFETNNIEECWDGNYKGQLAPQAVYVYKASGKFSNGREFNKAGSVLLVR